ncbi:uncharacterized protein M6B38_341465 [Iris pallida]|uniref:3'-5' exonuclease domain-containing protein n=1 Tax=Iris pallida TaxID=29817 RepID=A0AAX6GXD4_IRIPA|nr:uncharacterized protein M6B38_341465 [Iris pallida]
MDPTVPEPEPFEIHMVTSADSPELSHLRWALLHSSVVALDAEWKPKLTRTHRPGPEPKPKPEPEPGSAPSFPTVALLQIACRVRSRGGSPVFLVDLLSVPLGSVWEMIRDMLVSPSVLKLGFRFKQDLVYLSSTFCSRGCQPGFDRVEPFLDITSIYHQLKRPNSGKKLPKDTKSLATICEEILDISLSKELQCSDWSCRPLTKEQISYAAADACYLLEIFAAFECRILTEGENLSNITELSTSTASFGLKEILMEPNTCNNVLRTKVCAASDIVKSSTFKMHDYTMPNSWTSSGNIFPLEECILHIVRKYGERLLLKESDTKPRPSRKKGKRPSSANAKSKEQLECKGIWESSTPWDLLLGGDGCPKFLCDVMVEGLARHLRCVGIDAAIPSSKKPQPRQLLEQAYKEKRVLLTRDAKLLKHQYFIRNQVYLVKNLLKNDQLLEVIETFKLNISEDQLMSRCTKCNGNFIQKPLTMEEAIEAAKGFQVIPNCLFNRNIEFWQCTDCHQLYWEGTQYQNAVQKFVTVCKLNEQSV